MKEQKTMIVGLTGQTGAGKSTLSGLFREWGIPVIDADRVARTTIEGSVSCLSDLVLEFSTEVINADATLNRSRLAEICFGDQKKLKRLNEITFPYIIAEIGHKLEAACQSGAKMVLLDAPTLFESGLDKRCDRVAAVIASQEIRLTRIIARDQMTEEEAARRIDAQNDDDFYISRADDVLENSGEMGALRLAFVDLFNRYERIANSGDFSRTAHGEPEPVPSDEDFDELNDSE